MAFDSFAHIPLTPELLNHVWHGELSGLQGGHRFGLGREGKTEFPSDWDITVVAVGIRSVLARPQFVGHRGSIITLRREIGEVILEVRIRTKPKRQEIETAYPLNGSGVFRNQYGIKVPVPLNLQSLAV